LLNKDEIKQCGIVKNDDPQSYRAASYDLRIGRIIAIEEGNSKLTEETDLFLLPAQGMAEVISLETIKMPENVAGYASVMTRSARRGLLPLNTGIVDPGYQGPLSATVVNFGRSGLTLKRGEPFLRLTFHPYTKPEKFENPRASSEEEYIRDRKNDVAQNFSALFLNLSQHSEAAFRTALRRNLPVLSLLLALFALILSLFTWSVAFEFSYLQPYSISKDQVTAELGSYFRFQDFDALEKRIAADIQRKQRESGGKTASTKQEAPSPEAAKQPTGRHVEHK
jgi:deoxycytidine triphosphate deaminase